MPTIDGKVAVKVPPGSNAGTTLRLKGRGVQRDGQRGDQYVKLRVVLPDQADSELTDFLKRWSEAHPYDVRGKAGMG